MITKRDCILLLTELSTDGINTEEIISKAINSSDINLEVIKFINDHRPLDANLFYEKLRRSYNNKKSMLYKNIVTCDESDCTDSVLTTLSSLLLQIFLYMKDVKDKRMFMKHTRVTEINEVMLHYSKTYDLVPCIKVLQIIKADLKAFEHINKNM